MTKYVGSGDKAIKAAADDDLLRWAKEVLDERIREMDADLAAEVAEGEAEIAAMRAESEARSRASRAEQRAEVRWFREWLAEEDASGARADKEAIASARACLIAAGFRRHRRGEWRRTRGGETMATATKRSKRSKPAEDEPREAEQTEMKPAAGTGDPVVARAVQRYEQIMKIEELAKTDFHEARSQAKEFVRDFLADARLTAESRLAFHATGDPCKAALDALVTALAGESVLVIEMITSNVQSTRAALEGDDAKPIEKLVVGRIVANWVRLNHLDILATRFDSGTKISESISKMGLRAEARFAKLISTLHVLRSKVPTPIQLAMVQSVTVESPRLEDAGDDRQGSMADVLAGRGRALKN